MKMAFLQNTETRKGAKNNVLAIGPKITGAEFEAKMFVRLRDTAANVMYYAVGKSASFLRREFYRTL